MHAHGHLPSLVIVGNGMVTSRFLDELLTREGSQFRITVIGAEPHGSYNRIMLSSVLAKESSIAGIMQKDEAWFEQKGIRLKAGSTVTKINRDAKRVVTDDGEQISYDELVLATGSRAARIPAKNLGLNNIFTFRTIGDTQNMLRVAENASNALVVGGGLLGLEAAYGMANSGMAVTLVHRSDWLLNRQLDQSAGAMLKNVMEAMGIRFLLGDEVDAFLGDSTGAVTAAKFKSGKTLDIDMAVIATGISSNIELAESSGLKTQRAILVDDFMQSSDPAISAIGECIEHRGQTFGLVDPLWRQAETLAARLVEKKLCPFKNQAIATKLKVSGVQVFSAGLVEQDKEHRALVIRDEKAKVYRKLLIKDNVIEGIVLFGDVRSGQHYFELMQNKTDIRALLPNLLFGEAFSANQRSADTTDTSSSAA